MHLPLFKLARNCEFIYERFKRIQKETFQMRFKTQLFIIKVDQMLLKRGKTEADRLLADSKLYFSAFILSQ
jgi:hypothetical protein